MSFQKIPLNPGVYVDDTPLKAQGFFTASNKVRFVRGLPQVFGGWEYFSPVSLNGICRGLHAWADNNTVKWVWAGTHTNLYALTDQLPYDVTPISARGHISVNITTTLTSAVVTCGWTAHGMVAGQSFRLFNSTVATVGGVTISTTAATTAAPSPWYVVLAVNSANEFTFTAAQTASSGAGPTACVVDYWQFLAPGLSSSIGALGYGTGVYSTGSTYSSPATGSSVVCRTWSGGNYGQNLIASPNGGKIYEWCPATSAAELVTNGSFTGSATGWTVGANWAYGANAVTATLSSAVLSQSITLPANSFCLISFETSAFAAGTMSVSVGGTAVTGLTAIASNNTWAATFFNAGGAKTLAFTGTALTITLDNVSVKQLQFAEVVPNAPTQNTCVLVTPETFVMAFGTVQENTGAFNPMHIRWSDIGSVIGGEQIWTPASTNQSSFVTLGIGSRIVGAKVAGSEILVWTDKALYALTYVNNTSLVYSTRLVATDCGLIGPNAVGALGNGAYWMTPQGMVYAYSGGAPIPIKSTMSKDVFDHISAVQQFKITAGPVGQFSDMFWFYPDSRDGNECSRYTLLDTAEAIAPPPGTNPGIVGCFANGTFNITCWIDGAVFSYPIGAHNDTPISDAVPSGYTNLYFHEKGSTINGGSLSWSLQTGAIQLGNGDTLWQVNSFIPDFAGLVGGATLTAYASKWPQSATTTTGPFNFTAASEKIDLMSGAPIGREIKWAFAGNSSPAFMRTGNLMFDTVDTGMAF
ncbi:hypothetical protein UFOVP1623_43 [uncultured Caudovirales phage]|uniref:Uncharacterized protein n=1 Tax=uncultured Caudovirales phage TaxID=2100421 RepID=A0A6J5RZ75_9CAUD|nr:hypothetical protein UFOVP1376_20 [uncultured Caudovirales phage]CAB4220817.1 hypothetical protein UFOVP1623_43 [uncultured Caudovirales phage]